MAEEMVRKGLLFLSEKEKQTVLKAMEEGISLIEYMKRGCQAESPLVYVAFEDIILTSILLAHERDYATTPLQKRTCTNLLKKLRAAGDRMLPFLEIEEPDPMPKCSTRRTVQDMGAAVYQLHILLEGIEPAIWRRIQIRGEVTLAELHLAIQAAMGWENYHYYEFRVGARRFGIADEELEDDPDDAHLFTLCAIAQQKGKKIAYTYDYGDGWEHRIKVEKILAPEEGATYPRCLDGARACPPEDCGGVHGYLAYLEALKDPEHPEHEELLSWRGPFDPELFDIDKVNRDLQGLFTSGKKRRRKSK